MFVNEKKLAYYEFFITNTINNYKFIVYDYVSDKKDVVVFYFKIDRMLLLLHYFCLNL